MKNGKPVLRKEQNIATCVICLMTLLFSAIACRNETIGVLLFFTGGLSLAALISSLITRLLTRRIVLYTDRIRDTWKRVLFYICFFLFDVVAIYGSIMLAAYIEVRNDRHFDSLSEGLGYAFLYLIIVGSICIFLFTTYLQTVVVQLVRYIINRKHSSLSGL